MKRDVGPRSSVLGPRGRQRGQGPVSHLAAATLLLIALAAPAFGQLEVLSSEELREESAKNAAPSLDVAPRAFDASAEAGRTATFRLKISNAGGQKLSWKLRSNLPGIGFSVGQGEIGYRGSQVVDVSVPVGGQPGELLRGVVVVEAPGITGSPATVSVSVKVAAALPLLIESDRTPSAKLDGEGPTLRDTTPAGGPAENADASLPRSDGKPAVSAGGGQKRKGFGVHIGFAAPASGVDEEYLGGPAAGVHYRSEKAGKSLGLEFGLDIVTSSAGAGDADSSLVMAGAAALYRPRSEGAFYVMGGGRLVAESIEGESGVATALDLGGGVTFASGRMDLRATYSFLVGSNNVPGFGGVTLGYLF